MTDFAAELVAISRAFGLFERESVCCGTVSVPQCVALQALLRERLDIAGIAGELGVTASAATRLVDGLQARGWIERQRDPEDRRRIEVALTRDGRREAERLRTLTEQTIHAVLRAVPGNKRAQVVESLQLLRRAIEKARGGWADCCAPGPE